MGRSGPSWAPLRALGGLAGASWALVERSWLVWRLRRPSWGPLRAGLRPLGACSGHLGGPLGRLRGTRGISSHLGALMGRRGPVLGGILGHLGGLLGRLRLSEARQGVSASIFHRPIANQWRWRLGGSCGPLGEPLGGLMEPLGGLTGSFGASWSILGALLPHRAPSEAVLGEYVGRLGALLGRVRAVLEVSWAVLRRSWAS